MNLLAKQKQTIDLENELIVTKGEGLGKGIVQEFGIDLCTLLFLYLKWVTNKDPLDSTVNSAQYRMVTWRGEEFGEEWIHVYVWLSPFAVHLKLSHRLDH